MDGSAGKFYVVRFAQYHEAFRVPELEALSDLEQVPFSYDQETYDYMCPFLIIKVESDEQARKLIRRAILVNSIYHLWAQGDSYDALHADIRAHPELWPPFKECSFKFRVISFGRTRDIKDQVEIINEFAYLPFEGKIDLKTPAEVFGVLEDFGLDNNQTQPTPGSAEPRQLFMGRYVGQGSRDLVATYDLKKRAYLGTTSMDAELSLVMANMALARPNSLIYDPFVGTGSFLVCCSHFGAMTLGSDIDGRQVRGKGAASISTNVSQYGLDNRVLDTVIFDVCHHPWRSSTRFDAIVTDPPYGVRAGAKKLGRKGGARPLNAIRTFDGVPAHLGPNYFPPKINYEMPDVLADLLDFAAVHLQMHGRLVFWLPTAVEEGELPVIPSHPCLRLLADSEQAFNGWSRRLLTMVKLHEPEGTPASVASSDSSIALFRERYFRPKAH